MYLLEETEYISGLVNMASSVSTWMGVSFMDAICFNKENYLDDFSKFHNIKKEDIKIHETNISFEEFIKNNFGENKKLIDGLSYWIKRKAGDFIKVYEQDDDSNLNDLLEKSEYGKTPMFFIEDVVFIEFENMVISFITGNNE